jgi:hypothetical protein
VEGSELVFQYVAGSGLQLHPLANAGKLNDLWRKRNGNARVEQLLFELLPLAAERSGGAAWEYYFPYAGSAPWVSGMAQATMLQATARASIRLGIREETWPLLKSGLTMFATEPPAGVRVPSGDGAHYVLYSQRPGLKVLNGFAQALVGLYDFGAYANDDIARTLYADGDRALHAELPAYDTGAWSLYSREEVVREADLGYHRIATGFVGGLCERTLDPSFCDYESRFTRYLTEPPRVEVLTRRIRGGTTGQVKFGLSKVSQVSLRITRGDKLVHAGSARVPYGRRSFTWSAPRKRGLYGVQLTATDLAGNTASATGEVEVLKPRKTRKRRR